MSSFGISFLVSLCRPNDLVGTSMHVDKSSVHHAYVFYHTLRIGCQRNDRSKCHNRIQTQYCRWSAQEETRYWQGKGASQLGTEDIAERRTASHGVWFPESHLERGWREGFLIKHGTAEGACIALRAFFVSCWFFLYKITPVICQFCSNFLLFIFVSAVCLHVLY